MTWGNSTNVVTNNLDNSADSPAAARPDLKAALDELTNVIDGRGVANGVAPLNASTKVAATYLPDEINSSSATDLTLDPATGKVNIEEIIQLSPQTVSQLNARTDQEAGDVAYCSDGNSSSPCIAIYNGTDWKIVALGGTVTT